MTKFNKKKIEDVDPFASIVHTGVGCRGEKDAAGTHRRVGHRGREGGRAGPLRRLSGWGRRRSVAGRAKEQERRPAVRLALLAAARGGEAGAMLRSPGGEGGSGHAPPRRLPG